MNTGSSMDESLKHYVKYKHPDSKGSMLYDSIYMFFWKNENCRDRKLIIGHQGLEARPEVDYKGS